jgi:hypothetical protein
LTWKSVNVPSVPGFLRLATRPANRHVMQFALIARYRSQFGYCQYLRFGFHAP